MTYETLKALAEHVETGLLERQACGEVGDCHVEVVPDDMKIEAFYTVIRPVRNIVCSVKVASKL